MLTIIRRFKEMKFRLPFLFAIILIALSVFTACPDASNNNYEEEPWSHFGLEDMAIQKLRLFDDQLYSITKMRGLYRKNVIDKFSEWQYLGFEDTISDWRYARGVFDVYVNTENPTSIMISVFEADSINSSILISKDNGISWLSADSGMVYEHQDSLFQGIVGEIIGVNNVIYGSAGPDGIYITYDFGISWHLLRYFDDILYWGLKVHPINNQIMWVISSGPWGDSHISKSSDSGLSWEGLPESFTNLYQFVSDIALHPMNSDTVYVSAQGNIYKTDDFGDTWVQILSGDSLNVDDVFITINDDKPNQIILYGSNNTNFRSILGSLDGGISWREIDYPYDFQIYSQPIFDPTNQTLYFPTEGGVLKYNSFE